MNREIEKTAHRLLKNSEKVQRIVCGRERKHHIYTGFHAIKLRCLRIQPKIPSNCGVSSNVSKYHSPSVHHHFQKMYREYLLSIPKLVVSYGSPEWSIPEPNHFPTNNLVMHWDGWRVDGFNVISSSLGLRQGNFNVISQIPMLRQGYFSVISSILELRQVYFNVISSNPGYDRAIQQVTKYLLFNSLKSSC